MVDTKVDAALDVFGRNATPIEMRLLVLQTLLRTVTFVLPVCASFRCCA